MLNLNNIFQRNYVPLNKIEISKSNLLKNYKFLKSINKNVYIAPVLKSNAYGHGLLITAKILESLSPPFFCVDSLFEAYELLKIKIQTPILIMGYINPKSLITKKLPFSFAVFNYETLKSLSRYQPNAKIHIFVDTGMHREGISLAELPEYISYIKTKTNLQIEGLMSHFAESENPKNPSTLQQLDNFKTAINILNNFGVKPKFIHLGNSSALLNNKFYHNNIGNVARIGIAVYGIDPEGNSKNLTPVLTLKSHIAQIKLVKPKEKIGYNFTYQTKKELKIAIIPIGYYDGVSRKLSNLGFIKVGKNYCPIIGKVNMNITIINITDTKNVKVGQEVTIYSNNQNDKNSIKNTARLCGLIPYEILVSLAETTKRAIA
jgi:alanine racemase